MSIFTYFLVERDITNRPDVVSGSVPKDIAGGKNPSLTPLGHPMLFMLRVLCIHAYCMVILWRVSLDFEISKRPRGKGCVGSATPDSSKKYLLERHVF